MKKNAHLLFFFTVVTAFDAIAYLKTNEEIWAVAWAFSALLILFQLITSNEEDEVLNLDAIKQEIFLEVLAAIEGVEGAAEGDDDGDDTGKTRQKMGFH